MKRIKVAVTLEDRKVVLEGPEDFVRREVERLTSGEKADKSEQGRGTVDANPEAAARTERNLYEQKRPSGHSETVAVLALCLREAGMSEFSPEEMRKAYIRAGVRPPKVVAQALRDAKNKFDYIEAGETRGTFRLSPHGERTVLFDLPR